MNVLDDRQRVEKTDRHRMLQAIHNFSDQIQDAERIGQLVVLDSALGRHVSNIVFSGLGGSAIGADVIRSYLAYDLEIPIFVNRHYQLPRFVDDKTLLIVSSYSGDTEETLSALKVGIDRKARILGIASGGELARLAKRYGFPIVEIPKGFSPRAALGYSVIPLLIALSKLGFPRAYRSEEVQETRSVIRMLAESKYGMDVPSRSNFAKQLASNCFNQYPIIYSSADYFDVVAFRWRSQIEENAKALASHHVLPEMNHNELVGWRHPKEWLKKSIVFFLRDASDHKRVQLRINLSKKLVEQFAGKVVEVFSEGKGLLARMFSLIYLGDWISFYLAMLYGIDPTPVEVIQYLKSELAKAEPGR